MTCPSSRMRTVRTEAGIFGEGAGLFPFTGPFPGAQATSGTCAPWTPPPGASRRSSCSLYSPRAPGHRAAEQTSGGAARCIAQVRCVVEDGEVRGGASAQEGAGEQCGQRPVPTPPPRTWMQGERASGISRSGLPASFGDSILCRKQSLLRGQVHGRHMTQATGSLSPCCVRGHRASEPRVSFLIHPLRHLPGTELLL